jgi:hypothetical protein
MEVRLLFLRGMEGEACTDEESDGWVEQVEDPLDTRGFSSTLTRRDLTVARTGASLLSPLLFSLFSFVSTRGFGVHAGEPTYSLTFPSFLPSLTAESVTSTTTPTTDTASPLVALTVPSPSRAVCCS